MNMECAKMKAILKSKKKKEKRLTLLQGEVAGWNQQEGESINDPHRRVFKTE